MTAADAARAIVDATSYLVLATADADGRPWSTPVYFAHAGYREFFWVSAPTATHSVNIAVRPRVGGVVFDSTAPIGTGQGLYLSAAAERVADAGLARGLDVFSRRSRADGGRTWTAADLGPDAGMLLYRAVADAYWVLAKDGRPDHRVPVELA